MGVHLNGWLRPARLVLALTPGRGAAFAEGPTLAIQTPLSPPDWAVLERELQRANTAACDEFFAYYSDERGYLRCVERWGGDGGWFYRPARASAAGHGC